MGPPAFLQEQMLEIARGSWEYEEQQRNAK